MSKKVMEAIIVQDDHTRPLEKRCIDITVGRRVAHVVEGDVVAGKVILEIKLANIMDGEIFYDLWICGLIAIHKKGDLGFLSQVGEELFRVVRNAALDRIERTKVGNL
jgi:hypothetical protein